MQQLKKKKISKRNYTNGKNETLSWILMGPYSIATQTVLLSHMHAGLNFHATTVSQSAQKKKIVYLI